MPLFSFFMLLMMQCVTCYRFVKELCLTGTFHNGWFVAVKSFMIATEHVGLLAFYNLWCNSLTENGKERVCLSQRENVSDHSML